MEPAQDVHHSPASRSGLWHASTLIALVGVATVALVAALGAFGAIDRIPALLSVDVLQVIQLASASVAIWQLARAAEPGDLASVAWRTVFASCALLIAGNAIYAVLRVQYAPANVPYPSIADPLFALGQVAMTA